MINSHFDIRDSCTDLSRFLHENCVAKHVHGDRHHRAIRINGIRVIGYIHDISIWSHQHLLFHVDCAWSRGPFISTVFDPAGSSTSVIVCDNLMSVVHFVSGFSPSTIRLEFVYWLEVAFLRSLILAYILLWMLKCDPYVSPRILHHLYSSTNRVNKFLH